MDWTLLIIVVVVLAALFILKRATFVSADVARECLAAGAVVIDVRSPEEFRGGHVSGAINIPLGDLQTKVLQQVPDKHQALLLYCLSGGRSAISARQLKIIGYEMVFNLGSYSRAQQIVGIRCSTAKPIRDD